MQQLSLSIYLFPCQGGKEFLLRAHFRLPSVESGLFKNTENVLLFSALIAVQT